MAGSCTNGDEAAAISPEQHRAAIEEWRKTRDAALREDDGWLTLVGLFWLAEGKNRFGGGPDNDLVFPAPAEGSIPAVLGTFDLVAGEVWIEAEPGVRLTHAGAPVSRLLVRTDSDPEPTILETASLLIQSLERGKRFAIKGPPLAVAGELRWNELLSDRAGLVYRSAFRGVPAAAVSADPEHHRQRARGDEPWGGGLRA
jgi:hypothetical protein